MSKVDSALATILEAVDDGEALVDDHDVAAVDLAQPAAAGDARRVERLEADLDAELAGESNQRL